MFYSMNNFASFQIRVSEIKISESKLVIFLVKSFFLRFLSVKGIPFQMVDPVREKEFS